MRSILYCEAIVLKEKVSLCKGQYRCRLTFARNTVRYNLVVLWIYFHLWHCIVEFHVLLSNSTRTFNYFNALFQPIELCNSKIHRGLRNKGYAGFRNESGKHWA